MEKQESFNEMAQLYEKARPSYPEELIDDIIIKTNLGLKDRLLEIGAGTGKATIQLLKSRRLF